RFKKRLKRESFYNVEELDQVSVDSLMNELRLHSGQVLNHVYPALQLSYTRHRYFIPGTEIRLCIDSDIHVEKVNTRLICKSLKPKMLSHCVFEVKGETAVLPRSLVSIEKFGFAKSSFSKYEQCINELVC
ncbi:MAG: VTC domain-containing protein, partial [Pseudomonadota bacterium]